MMTETVVTIDPNRNPNLGQPKPAGGNLNWVQFNLDYFRTIPGILKLVQLVLGILCIVLATPALIGATHYFLFVAVTSFIATILWAAVYLLGIREVLNLAINWILTEMINAGIITILYLIAFILQLAKWASISSYSRSSNIAAGVLGLFNTLAYAFGAYILFVEHRNSLQN